MAQCDQNRVNHLRYDGVYRIHCPHGSFDHLPHRTRDICTRFLSLPANTGIGNGMSMRPNSERISRRPGNGLFVRNVEGKCPDVPIKPAAAVRKVASSSSALLQAPALRLVRNASASPSPMPLELRSEKTTLLAVPPDSNHLNPVARTRIDRLHPA